MTYRLDDIDIRVFKLTSGEEIISLVSSTEGDKVYLEFPLQVHKRVMKDTHAFAFSDWQPLGNAQNKVTVNLISIMSSCRLLLRNRCYTENSIFPLSTYSIIISYFFAFVNSFFQ